MTIIVAIPVQDGLIIASDGQITSGGVRALGKKIKKLNDHCLWSASGESALIQRIEETLASLANKDRPLQSLRDELARSIRQSVANFYQLVSRPIDGDFIFVEYRDSPRILHIMLDGTPEWIDRSFASGNGSMFAYALLQKYQSLFPDKINVQKGSLLAFKIIEETIEVGAYGLGPPIDVWLVTKDGIKNLEKVEITALEDTSHALREAELKLFLSEEKSTK